MRSRAPAIEIGLQTPREGRVAVQIDGKSAAGGTLKRGEATLPAAAAVSAIAMGKRLTIRTAGGKLVGQASLAGAAAALRFINAEQELAGTRAALVARGTKPATSRVPAPLPVIPAIRPPSGDAPEIAPTLLKAMTRLSRCDEAAIEEFRTESHRLDARTTLVLLPCGSGAYSFNFVPFVVTGGRPSIAKLDSPTGLSEEDATTLTNAELDAETGRLSSYAKGSGIGDCGSSRAFVWDGAMFRLVEAKEMGPCRGSVNWLTIWRAAARPR